MVFYEGDALIGIHIIVTDAEHACIGLRLFVCVILEVV